MKIKKYSGRGVIIEHPYALSLMSLYTDYWTQVSPTIHTVDDHGSWDGGSWAYLPKGWVLV